MSYGISGQMLAAFQLISARPGRLIFPAIRVEFRGATSRHLRQIQGMRMDLGGHIGNATVAGLWMRAITAGRLPGPGAAPAVERMSRLTFDVKDAVQTAAFCVRLEGARNSCGSQRAAKAQM